MIPTTEWTFSNVPQRRQFASQPSPLACIDYNKGSCKWDNCRYKHVCQLCGSFKHGILQCQTEISFLFQDQGIPVAHFVGDTGDPFKKPNSQISLLKSKKIRMIRNWYNEIPHPAPKTKREITKCINCQQFTKALAVTEWTALSQTGGHSAT